MAIIEKQIRERTVEKDGLLTAINREFTPLLRELVREVNRVGGNVTTISADYDVLTSDRVILCTDTALDITLPYAENFKNQFLLVKKGGAAAVNVILNAQTGETIDGAATQTLVQTYGYMELISDGVVWHISRET